MSQSKINEYVGVKNGFSSLKRKRQYEEYLESTEEFSTDAKTCFTNSAFSSTPKRVVARRRTPLTITNNFIQNPCLEVKSIADIINTPVEKEEISEVQTGKQPQNPYEVVRKPPKKKKRETEIIEACFENPALNLELPEKQFNPYEVCREFPAKQRNAIQSNCFVNAALNLRAQDATISRNLYEIQRCDNVQPSNAIVGVENAGLEEAAVLPTDLKIALPFKPTLGCRIDFSNLPIEQLTPSKLLADKLVFSPVLVVPKRSMDSASEESSMDIGKELDRYQLELENSINEAKIRKTAGACVESKTTELRLQVDLEQRITFTQRLAEIVEEDEDKINDCSEEEMLKSSTSPAKPVASEKFEIVKFKNNDVAYASDSEEDELDFKEPAPFVRAYQRSTAPLSADSTESIHSTESGGSMAGTKKSLNVGNIVRKSLRKLMHPIRHGDIPKSSADAKDKHLLENNEEETKDRQQHNSAFKIIRNSLRRKAPTKAVPSTPQASVVKAEISIIDTSERTMKLKAELLPKTESDRKHTLRNSLRRSSREIGQHLMKTVFHKNQEAYKLTK
ncbi:uncharacterized protein LOC129237726 [Anastrepha obliqua]|uniref:uncharacterized protein LOC129237726 n=1 Tax=Anastrepha obliqua TaxID=95512 RepID=UPI00240A1B83|nr:uncharacterized protein LOC129237726 [Anastrepha obliqua]